MANNEHVEEWAKDGMKVLNARLRERNTITMGEFEQFVPLFTKQENVSDNVDIDELCVLFKQRFSLYEKIYIVESMHTKDEPILILPPMFRAIDPINNDKHDLSSITSALDTAFRVNDDFKIKRNNATARVLKALNVVKDTEDIKRMQEEYVELSKQVVEPKTEISEITVTDSTDDNTITTSSTDWDWD